MKFSGENMLEEITKRIVKLVDGKDPFGFDVRWDIDEVGSIFVSAKKAPIQVSNLTDHADTIFIISEENLNSILDGDLSAMNAYFSGQLKVEGDIGKAMQLSSIFG